MMSIMRKFKELQRPSYCAHHHAHCSSTNPSKVQWFRLFISHLYSSRGPSSLFNAPLPVRSSHWPIYLIADSPVLWRRRRLSATQRPMHGPWWTQIIILLLEMIRSPLDNNNNNFNRCLHCSGWWWLAMTDHDAIRDTRADPYFLCSGSKLVLEMGEWIKKQITFIICEARTMRDIWILKHSECIDSGWSAQQPYTRPCPWLCENSGSKIFSTLRNYKNQEGGWSSRERKKAPPLCLQPSTPVAQPASQHCMDGRMPVNDDAAVSYMVKLNTFHPQILPISLPPTNFHFLLHAHKHIHKGMKLRIRTSRPPPPLFVLKLRVCVFKVFNKREMNFPCVERDFHRHIPTWISVFV